MGDVYTMGTWTVKDGEEKAFVAAWLEFVRWGSSLSGAGTFRLIRDLSEPARFVSFADWDSLDEVRAWKETPEFRVRMGEVQRHVSAFTPLELEAAATFDARSAV
jgi:heme-degrading monooxygenase HmoA